MPVQRTDKTKNSIKSEGTTLFIPVILKKEREFCTVILPGMPREAQ
jgi:hypothetical protein